MGEEIFEMSAVNAVDIKITSIELSDKLSDYSFCLHLCEGYKIEWDVLVGIYHKVLSGDNPILFSSVTPGWAFDFDVWARKHLPGVSFEFAGKSIPEDHVSFPLNPQQNKHDDADKITISNLNHDLSMMTGDRNRLRAKNDQLIEELGDRNTKISELNNRIVRMTRSLQSRFTDVRIDPNDPDTYIVRPSAFTEARLIGQLDNDVINIVIQVLKPKALAKLDAADRADNHALRPSRHFPAPGHVFAGRAYSLSPGITAVNGPIMKALRKASKPNTRGSMNGAKRVLSNLEALYVYRFWECEQLHVRNNNHTQQKHLRNSKFNW